MSKFSDALSIEVLKESLAELDIPHKWLVSKEEAVRSIYQWYHSQGLGLDYTCPECQADIPRVVRCPFCGTRFDGSGEVVSEDDSKTVNYGFVKVGGVNRKDMKKADGTRPKELCQLLIDKIGYPKTRYRLVKTGYSLWIYNTHKPFCYLLPQKDTVVIYVKPEVALMPSKFWAAIKPVETKTFSKTYRSQMTIGNKAAIDIAAAVIQEALRVHLDELNRIQGTAYTEGPEEQ